MITSIFNLGFPPGRTVRMQFKHQNKNKNRAFEIIIVIPRKIRLFASGEKQYNLMVIMKIENVKLVPMSCVFLYIFKPIFFAADLCPIGIAPRDLITCRINCAGDKNIHVNCKRFTILFDIRVIW